MRELVQAAVREILALRERTGVLHLCEQPLDAHDRRALREAAKYTLERRRKTRAVRAFFPGRVLGWRIARVPVGLPPAADSVLDVGIGARLLSQAPSHRRLHELVSVVAFFCDGYVDTRPKADVLRARRSLRALDVGWYYSELPTLWLLAGAVRRHLALSTFTARELLKLGKAERDAAHWRAADRHLARAIAAGRAETDTEVVGLAALNRAIVACRRGNSPRAEHWYHRAARFAHRHRLVDLEGQAAHGLLVGAAKQGDEISVRLWARRALALYGDGSPGALAVALDVAAFWMDSGDAAAALPVFCTALDHGMPERHQIIVRGNVAAAAGMLSQEQTFDAALPQVLADLADQKAGAAEAGWWAAKGAAALGRYALATELARRSLAVAEERAEAEFIIRNEHLVRELGDARARLPGRSFHQSRTADLEFSAEVVRRLQRAA